MKKMRKLLSLLTVLALCAAMLAGALTVHASTVTTNRYNIMLVVDGSGSINKKGGTDENGYRYNAVDLFLGLLPNSGNNVGAIVFDDDLILDTRMQIISGTIAKQNLSNKIRNATLDYGDTDIGLALSRAVETLVAAQEENGLPSVVILMTDGKTDLDNDDSTVSAEELASEVMLYAAVDTAEEEGIKIFTVALNGSEGWDEAYLTMMQDIADRTGGASEEIKSAEDLVNVYQSFYAMIYTVYNPDTITGSFDSSGKFSASATVPSFGIEELNIIVETSSGLEDITLTVEKSGNVYTMADLEEEMIQTSSLSTVKVVDPEGGTWQIELTGVPGEAVSIDLVFNANVSMQLQLDEDTGSYMSEDSISFSARVYESSSLVTDTTAYDSTNVTLVLTNMLDVTDSYSYAMTGTGSSYTATISLPEVSETTTYLATVKSTICNISLESDTLILDVNPIPEDNNTAPTANQNPVTLSVQGESEVTCDLDAWFTDTDEDDSLTYALASSDYAKDVVTIDGSTLKIANNGMLDGTIKIRATDQGGLSCLLEVQIEGNSAPTTTVDSVTHRVTVTPFLSKSDSLDLTEYFTDEEDTSLSYTIVTLDSKSDTASLISIESGTLVINTSGFAKTDLVVRATDSDGASCDLTIHLTVLNVGLLAGGSLTIILVIVGIILLITTWIALNRRYAGSLEVTTITKKKATATTNNGGGIATGFGGTDNGGFGNTGGFTSAGFGNNGGFGSTGGFTPAGFGSNGGFGNNGSFTSAGFGNNGGFSNNGPKPTEVPAFRGKKSMNALFLTLGNVNTKSYFQAMGKTSVRFQVVGGMVYNIQNPNGTKRVSITTGMTVEIFEDKEMTNGLKIVAKQGQPKQRRNRGPKI